MSEHRHSSYVEGCFRCDLSRDEVRPAIRMELTPEQVTAIVQASPDYERQVAIFAEIADAKPCAVCGDPEHAMYEGHLADSWEG